MIVTKFFIKKAFFNGTSTSFIDPSYENGQPIFDIDGYITRQDAMQDLDKFFRTMSTDTNNKTTNLTVEPQFIVLELHGWKSANYGNISFS